MTVEFSGILLAEHELYATRTIGRLIQETLNLGRTEFHSGPLGGDQQIGATIEGGEVECTQGNAPNGLGEASRMAALMSS